MFFTFPCRVQWPAEQHIREQALRAHSWDEISSESSLHMKSTLVKLNTEKPTKKLSYQNVFTLSCPPPMPQIYRLLANQLAINALRENCCLN